MKSIKRTVLGVLAFVTCPCHLPLLAVLLVGTSAGAWVARQQRSLFILMAILFSGSIYLFLRALNERRIGP